MLSRLIILVVYCYSCTGESSQSQEGKNDEENWVLAFKDFSTHTYTPSGLLDTSFKTFYYYYSGKIMDSVKSIIVRKYSNSLLTTEREFTIPKEGSEIFANEKINQYDLKGNLILERENIGNNLIAKTLYEYNDNGQVLKSTHFSQEIKQNSYDNNLDSVTAHRNDKKVYEFDTTIENNTYDRQGNLVQAVQTNTKGIVLKTFIHQYYENQKIFSYTMNSQGDTVLKVNYQHENGFTKEIHIIKELGAVDTFWVKNDKIIKAIGHNVLRNTKNQTLYKYNAKNEEIESTSYR